MRFLSGVAAGILIVAAAAVAFAFSGLFDVAASRADTWIENWGLHTVAERSIARRADAEVKEVPNLKDEAAVAAGARHFRMVCAQCHGGPGVPRSALGAGLNPLPPDLAHAQHWGPTEQFWIVKHGIKMTGMPGWGRSSADRELWDVVAFLQALPRVTPDEYERLAKGEPKH